MKHFLPIFLILCCSIIVSSCGKSAADYAKQYCNCSPDLARATLQHKNGLISQTDLAKVIKTHEDCMGTDDPLQALEKSPEEKEQFKAEFIQALEKNCPNIARDMGY